MIVSLYVLQKFHLPDKQQIYSLSVSLPYGITASDIVAYNIILLLKSSSDRLLSIFLKAMVMGEAIAKLTLIVKGATIENSMSYIFV